MDKNVKGTLLLYEEDGGSEDVINEWNEISTDEDIEGKVIKRV